MNTEEIVTTDIGSVIEEALEGEEEGSTFIGMAQSDDGAPLVAVGIVHNGEVIHTVQETDEDTLREWVGALGYTLEKIQ